MSESQPSAHIDMSPSKARLILRDGHVNGKPLIPKQRRLFGVIAGKSKKSRTTDLPLQYARATTPEQIAMLQQGLLQSKEGTTDRIILHHALADAMDEHGRNTEAALLRAATEVHPDYQSVGHRPEGKRGLYLSYSTNYPEGADDRHDLIGHIGPEGLFVQTWMPRETARNIVGLAQKERIPIGEYNGSIKRIMGDSPEQYAAYRAPAGGIVVRGNYYSGGSMIPDLEGAFANPPHEEPKKMSLRERLSVAIKRKKEPLTVSYAREISSHYSRDDDTESEEEAEGEVKTVPIASILPDKENLEEAVQNYRDGKRTGDSRPLEVYPYPAKDKYVLADGHHRLIEAICDGKNEVEVRCRDHEFEKRPEGTVKLKDGKDYYGLRKSLSNGDLLPENSSAEKYARSDDEDPFFDFGMDSFYPPGEGEIQKEEKDREIVRAEIVNRIKTLRARRQQGIERQPESSFAIDPSDVEKEFDPNAAQNVLYDPDEDDENQPPTKMARSVVRYARPITPDHIERLVNWVNDTRPKGWGPNPDATDRIIARHTLADALEETGAGEPGAVEILRNHQGPQVSADYTYTKDG